MIEEKLERIYQKGWVNKPALLFIGGGLSHNKFKLLQKKYPILPTYNRKLRYVPERHYVEQKYFTILLMPIKDLPGKNLNKFGLKRATKDEIIEGKRLNSALEYRRIDKPIKWYKSPKRRPFVKKYFKLKLKSFNFK